LNPNIAIGGLERDWNSGNVLKSVTEEEDWFVLGKLRQQQSSGVSYEEWKQRFQFYAEEDWFENVAELWLVFGNSIKSMWV